MGGDRSDAGSVGRFHNQAAQRIAEMTDLCAEYGYWE